MWYQSVNFLYFQQSSADGCECSKCPHVSLWFTHLLVSINQNVAVNRGRLLVYQLEPQSGSQTQLEISAFVKQVKYNKLKIEASWRHICHLLNVFRNIYNKTYASLNPCCSSQCDQIPTILSQKQLFGFLLLLYLFFITFFSFFLVFSQVFFFAMLISLLSSLLL